MPDQAEGVSGSTQSSRRQDGLPDSLDIPEDDTVRLLLSCFRR